MAHHLQVDREKFLALVKERLDHFERKSKRQTIKERKHMETNIPSSNSKDLTRCYGKMEAVNGLSWPSAPDDVTAFSGATARARPRPSNAC